MPHDRTEKPLAGAHPGNPDTQKKTVHPIVWFLALSVLLYMVGHVYGPLPEKIIPVYQWALGFSFAALASCLAFYASSGLRAFLPPKVVKALDRMGLGI